MSTAAGTAGHVTPDPFVGSRGWMSTGRAAKRLGYSRKTLWRMCSAGEIPGARRLPGGDWRIPLEWVRAQIPAVVRRPPRG